VLRLERDRMPGAIIFDLDGVLMDSEQLWNGHGECPTTRAEHVWKRVDGATERE
jgi:phosphoglycolate phosphatase-like HAD superfamily hydrolase